MIRIKKDIIIKNFNRNLYNIEKPLFITSEQYWDGGIQTENSLSEKSDFYTLASKMSEILKELIVKLNEDIYISESLCENSKIYAQWSDLKKYELFRLISKKIKRKKHYKLSLPEDATLIDMIVESNFRYLTHISLYLPRNEIIIQPTCHTEIIIYTSKNEEIRNVIYKAIPSHSNIEIR